MALCQILMEELILNWLKIIGDNFSIGYLLSILHNKDFTIIGAILSSYNYEFWDHDDYIENLIVDFLSNKKINLWR